MTAGTHKCNVKKIFTGSEGTAPQQLTGGELFVNTSLPMKDTQSGQKIWDRAAEAPPHHFELRKRKNMAMAIRILSLLLFLQVVFFPWLFLWSLQSFLNTWRGQFDYYFIVVWVIIRLLSFPALKHCRRTDWSRILKRSEKHNSLQSICQRKSSLPLWYHKAPQCSLPSQLPRLRETCFVSITAFRQYFFRLEASSPKEQIWKCKPKLMFSSVPLWMLGF